MPVLDNQTRWDRCVKHTIVNQSSERKALGVYAHTARPLVVYWPRVAWSAFQLWESNQRPAITTGVDRLNYSLLMCGSQYGYQYGGKSDPCRVRVVSSLFPRRKGHVGYR
eukprot:1354378-Pyramimonas_sp.AAC.1